jgi:hypothetical protein
VVGGIATFFAINALDELVKVGIGTSMGWLVGLAIYVQLDEKKQIRRTGELRTRTRLELVEEARQLGISGTEQMSSEDLMDAIARGGVQPDRAAEAMKDTLDGAKNQLDRVRNRKRKDGR